MDRALLERMVGAAVLVFLFVVFVPALLDGRDAAEPVDERLQPGAATRTEVIVLNGPRATDEPAAPESAAEHLAVSAEPAAVPAAPPTDQPPREQPTQTPAPAQQEPSVPAQDVDRPKKAPPAEGFAVQLGSFGSRDNAVSFASGLSSKGYSIFVVRGSADAGAIYRVYAGPRPTRSDAEALAARLKGEGQAVLVVDLGARSGG